MSKLANGISDTPVLMAAKAHLRNNRPLVVALSTNDALGMNLKNIGILLNTKNIYFVPFGQDDYKKKTCSMSYCVIQSSRRCRENSFSPSFRGLAPVKKSAADNRIVSYICALGGAELINKIK